MGYLKYGGWSCHLKTLYLPLYIVKFDNCCEINIHIKLKLLKVILKKNRQTHDKLSKALHTKNDISRPPYCLSIKPIPTKEAGIPIRRQNVNS